MKMKRKMTAFFTALAFLCGGVSAFNAYMPPVSTPASAETVADYPCSITEGKNSSYAVYGSKEYVLYTAEEAQAAGVPEGYEGNVIKVVPMADQINCGVLLDFSDAEIPFTLIKSLQFRVYLAENAANTGIYPQIRIPRPSFVGSQWVYQDQKNATPDGEWTTVTVDNSLNNFSSLKNEDGNLGTFELAMRTNSAIDFYIDDISYTLIDNDGVAPVIAGVRDDAIAAAGTPFVISATAFDMQENRSVALSQTWSEGAMDEEGNLLKGVHTLTLTAVDFFGNVAEKQVTVTVIEPDTQPPVIHIPSAIYTEVGAIFLYNFSVTDNLEGVVVTYTWSNGAFDDEGKLTEGIHVLIVVATDRAGNQTKMTTTVYVTEDGNGPGEIIDEEILVQPDVEDSEEESSEEESSEEVSSDEDSAESVESSEIVSEESSEEESEDLSTDTDSDEMSEQSSETVSEPATDEEESSQSSADNSTEKKQGCASVVGFAPLCGVALAGVALLLKKRKED